jgi:hypothetical protein
MKEMTTMLKSLAISLLTLTAVCSSAAFAGNGGPPSPDQDDWWCTYVPFLCGDHDLHHDHHHHHHPGSGPMAAPEIDPAAAMAALSLLAGGLAVMRGRRSTRKSV